MGEKDDRSGADVASEASPPGPLSRLLQDLAQAPELDFASAWRDALEPGDAVGRYRVGRQIGRGGFGAVYEALDPELGRAVALKALRPGRSRRELSQDWIRAEAEAVARLDHPCIVTIHDVGTCPSGPFLVMERLHGETLATRLEKGPLPRDEALRLAEDVARALAHAHHRGVLHRDLKPANVFLCADGRVKLLDFGLAHLLGRATPAGAGTPGYMSPEQARGDPVDERADVWAAAMVFGEVLTGHRPDPPGPSPRLPGVPRPLARAIGTGLTLDPAGRPRDGQVWLELLLAAARRLEQLRSARRVALLAATGVLLGLLVAGIATWRVWRDHLGEGARRITRVAVADVANGTGDPDLAGLSGLLAVSLQQSRRLEIVPRSHLLDVLGQLGEIAAVPVDEARARRVARVAGIGVLLLPAVHLSGGQYVLEVRAVDPLGDRTIFAVEASGAVKSGVTGLVDQVSEGSRRALDEDASEIRTSAVRVADAVTPSLEAYRHYFAGMDCVERPTRAGNWRVASGDCAAELRKAVEIDPAFALGHYQLALATYVPFTRNDESRTAVEAALQHVAKAPPQEQILIRALAAELADRYDEARALYARALAGQPPEKRLLFRAGDLEYHQEEYARAVPLLEWTLRLDPTHEWALDHLPRVLGNLGRRDALEARVREWSGMAPTVPVLHALATAHLWLGEPARAVDAARREVEAGGGEAAQDDLAGALAGVGDPRGAEAVLRALPGSGPAVRLAVVLGVQGRFREARRAVEGFLWRYPEQRTALLHVDAALAAAAGDLGAAWRAARTLREGKKRDYAASLAPAFAYLGDAEHAAALAQDLEPGWPDENLYLAIAEWKRGDGAAAKARLRALEETNPLPSGQIPPALLRAEIAAEAGQDGEAVEALRRYRSLPQLGLWQPLASPRAQLLLARCLERLGQPAAAREAAAALLEAWKGADPGLAQLEEARELHARMVRSEGARPGR